MNLLNKLVNKALERHTHLQSLKLVVEKEILHRDILRIMKENHFLDELIFIGGTCLRCCYGGIRLSEDLDFTCSQQFSQKTFTHLSSVLAENLAAKYRLSVTVSDPSKDTGNVRTWKIKIETRPEVKHMPAQRINIDICTVSSYETTSVIVADLYAIDNDIPIIINAQSKEEIFTDKLIAFALRPNRVKYRDLWDMAWLQQQGISPHYKLIPQKLADRNFSLDNYINAFQTRLQWLETNEDAWQNFHAEMRRFLPTGLRTITTEQDFGVALINFLRSSLNVIKCK